MSEERKPAPRRGFPKRSHPGRGGVKVTPERRKKVEVLVAAHMSERNIAAVIGLSPTTLRKHFRDELDSGFARRNAEVLMAQFESATKGNVAAQKEWLKRSSQQAHISEFKRAKSTRAPKEPKVGKKEAALIAAHNPDQATSMGEKMARRMANRQIH